MFKIPPQLWNHPMPPVETRTVAQPRRGLVASAAKITAENARVTAKPASNQWQLDAWDAYDLVGEFWFLVNAVANKAKKARLYIARVPKDPTETPEPVEDQAAEEVLESILIDAPSQEKLISRAVLNFQVAGEVWLAGIIQEDSSYRWLTLSVGEVKQDAAGSGWTITHPDGRKVSYKDDDIVLVRLWQEHPREAVKADASSAAALPILRELIELTKSVSASVDSRLAGAGVLAVSKSMQDALKPADSEEYDEDGMPIIEEAAEDPFTDSLITAMSTAIKDRGSAAAVVPIVVTVPDDLMKEGKAFEHIQFGTPFDKETQGLREEAIQRLAHTLDVPPELLIGLSDSNHWNAWLVQKDTIDSHVAPYLSTLCTGLTTDLLRPTLEEAGINGDHLMVWYDVEHLYSRPNRETDAMNLYDRRELSGEGLRKVLGFDEEDAPESTDPAVSMAMDLIGKAPSLLATKTMAEIVDDIRDLLNGEGAGAASVASPEATRGMPEA